MEYINCQKGDDLMVTFTEQEISVIDKKLGFIVFDWAKRLVSQIITKAISSGVDVLYWNTPESLSSGANDTKVDYFYNRLPQQLGFQKEQANLRGKGKEFLWAMHLDSTNNEITASFLAFIKTAAKEVTLDQIPSNLQGAFINMIGRKPFYTKEDIEKVLSRVSGGKQKEKKSLPKYYYDWGSKTWSGAQRFSDKHVETVVLQKLPSEIQDFIEDDPVLLKLWSYFLSQPSHFGADVIGFALVSKISRKTWVINEIQSDCVNSYLSIRGSYYKDKKSAEKQMDWETLKDMLEAQNKSKWIPILEANEAAKQAIMGNPNMIQQLPDNSQDIQKWISENATGQRGLDLVQHFNGVNFNSKIFRVY